jgi:hypothetical protein
MCTISYIGDYSREYFPARYPQTFPSGLPNTIGPFPYLTVSREEFESLKRDVEELKLLLQAAKRFDEKTDQPHCENEEKVRLLKQLAELVGVNLEDCI